MKISLTKAQVLERRRIADGLEPLRTDCAIQFTDGIDIDRMIEHDLRSRYVAMLDEAAPRYLAVECIEPVRVEAAEADGVRLTLPKSCRRVFDIELENWYRPVAVQPVSMYGAIVSWQHNEYREATPLNPIAVVCPDGDIMAWPGGKLLTLHGIIDPGEDLYVLDDSGLPLLLNN